ncbi:MAG: DUF354 domain-containing protein [Bacteroidota bacterium]
MGKKLIFEVGHPNDVHQFKYLYCELKKVNWDILFVAKIKDIDIQLLKAYKLPYKIIGKTRKSLFGKFMTLFIFSFRYYLIARKFKPDFILSRNSPHSAQVSYILSVPHIGFADTENSGLIDLIAIPNINYIFTSLSFKKKYKIPQFYYSGYIETWYLHPSIFSPNLDILKYLNIKEGESYSIVRFISRQAYHDKFLHHLADSFKIILIKKLLNYGKVFISSENELPPELKPYKFNLSANMIHDALYYSSIFYGESATMASECAMLGVPAIFIDPVGRGYTDEQESKFGLVSNFNTSEDGLQNSLLKIDDILSNVDYLLSHKIKHEKLLNEIINPVNYIKWFLENYPNSVEILKNDINYWKNFK